MTVESNHFCSIKNKMKMQRRYIYLVILLALFSFVLEEDDYTYWNYQFNSLQLQNFANFYQYWEQTIAILVPIYYGNLRI